MTRGDRKNSECVSDNPGRDCMRRIVTAPITRANSAMPVRLSPTWARVRWSCDCSTVCCSSCDATEVTANHQELTEVPAAECFLICGIRQVATRPVDFGVVVLGDFV